MNTERLQDVLREHLAVPEDKVADAAESFAREVRSHVPLFYHAKQDVGSLNELRRALQVIERWSDDGGASRATRHELEIKILTADPDNLRLFRQIQDKSQQIRDAVASKIRKVERSPRSRERLSRLNISEIHAVHVSWKTWDRWHERPAPVSYKETSAFFKYVEEVFAVFALTGKPRSAFKKWLEVREHLF